MYHITIMAVFAMSVVLSAAIAENKSGSGHASHEANQGSQIKQPNYSGQDHRKGYSKYQGAAFDAKGNTQGMESITLQHEGARRTK
jgi:hypothetical protein